MSVAVITTVTKMWMVFIVAQFTKCIVDILCIYSDHSCQQWDKFIYEENVFSKLIQQPFFIFWEPFLLLWM